MPARIPAVHAAGRPRGQLVLKRGVPGTLSGTLAGGSGRSPSAAYSVVVPGHLPVLPRNIDVSRNRPAGYSGSEAMVRSRIVTSIARSSSRTSSLYSAAMSVMT